VRGRENGFESAGRLADIDHRKDLDPTIFIPATASSTRYFGGVFLLFWLGGWVMGETSAITQTDVREGRCLIIFWLGGWTIGGIFAALTGLSDISSDRARNAAAEARQHSLRFRDSAVRAQ
jgi:hypothetical protein